MSAAILLRNTARTIHVCRPSMQTWRAPTSLSTGVSVNRSVRQPVAIRAFSMSRTVAAAVDPHDPHHEESFEEFTARYEQEFEQVQDSFELQRNLNNCFAYDLVPSPSVIIAALRAARRVNDYPTAVRVFEGIKSKVENKGQYDEYVKELADIREELGINLKESMYPDSK